MRNYILATFIIAIGISHCCQPKEVKIEESTAETFEALPQMITAAKWKPDETLIVMDNDNTLTMMDCPVGATGKKCQYLGGPAWYSWQSELIKQNSSSPYRVAESGSELIEIASLLFAVNEMGYTDPSIPEVLSTLTAQGAKLLVLTARGSSTVSATEMQLRSNKVNGQSVNYNNFLDLINQNALVARKSKISSIAGPFLPESCNISLSLPSIRQVTYQQGVMYVAGQNKGAMLQCILDKTSSKRIKNILFIDDTEENVKDVYQAFKQSRSYNVKSIWYTRLKEHKERLTRGAAAAKLQRLANERWKVIKKTLDRELLEPALP